MICFGDWLIGVIWGRIIYHVCDDWDDDNRFGFAFVSCMFWPMLMPFVITLAIITMEKKK